MAIFSVEAISEITSINPKSCRIKRATFTCYFCNTGQHRNEDEEVITLGNTPEAWSWQTAADRS